MIKTTLLAILATATAASASWTTYSLPTTTASFNTWGLGHTTDGQFIYGEDGVFYRQDSFGNGAYSQYSNSPGVGADPSFIATGNASAAVLGRGGFSPTSLMSFNPGDLSSSFTDTSFTIQNYAGKMRDANSLYIVGGNGTGGSNNLTYVTLDGATTKTLINDISQYSCGFTMDTAGNLYVGDNDDGNVYYFSKTQLDGALSGSALSVDDGSLVADFGSGGNLGSLAVDANGVLWAAGWNQTGIVSYDQSEGDFTTWTPGFASSHYLVDTFSEGGSDYVAFASADNFAAGSNVVYGYADAAAVPEPSSVVLLVGGFGGLVWFRRRRKYFFRG